MEKVKEATVEAFELKGGLSGAKTVVGILLLTAAHQLDAVNDIAVDLCTNFDLCGLSLVDKITSILEVVTSVSERVLEFLGAGFLSTGLLDKVLKFLKGLLK